MYYLGPDKIVSETSDARQKSKLLDERTGGGIKFNF